MKLFLGLAFVDVFISEITCNTAPLEKSLCLLFGKTTKCHNVVF